MLRGFMTAAIFSAALAVSTTANAQKEEFGTAAEAKAMLERVVVAFKADPAKTIAQITKGEGGFKEKDLYPVCSRLRTCEKLPKADSAEPRSTADEPPAISA